MPEVRCKICGKKFYAKPNWLKIGWGKYCSTKCQHKAQLRGRFVFCKICGKRIWRAPKRLIRSKSREFFCGKSHQTLWRNRIFIGPRHPNWKGGKHRKLKSILIQNKIKQICKICGCKDKRVLAVHHLDKNRRNSEVRNLVWLCHNCHHLVHRYKIKISK